MDFIIGYCGDTGRDGFFAGYDGWPESGTVTRHTYKSVEHNIDMYAAPYSASVQYAVDNFKTPGGG